MSFQSGFRFGKQECLLGLIPENSVDGAQRMSDVLPDNCGWGATREPSHCRLATSKSGFPSVQSRSCAQPPSNALKLPATPVCLPSDHVVQIHNEQCLSNQKIQPTTPWSLTDSSSLSLSFLSSRRPFPQPHAVLAVCLVKQMKCLCKIFTKFAAKFHTHTLFFKLFHCHFVTNPTNSLCTCSVRRM